MTIFAEVSMLSGELAEAITESLQKAGVERGRVRIDMDDKPLGGGEVVDHDAGHTQRHA